MKSHRDGTKRRPRTLRAWTYEEARKALPYVTSIMSNLREYRLEALQHDRTAKELARRPGRPDRATIIAREDAVSTAQQVDARYQESLEELHSLDVFCLDPLRGEAVIPFAHNEQLAWFLYDLFDDTHIRFWRYHTDSLETRRPLAEALADEREQLRAV